MSGDHDRTSGTPDESSGHPAHGDDLISDVLETVRLRGAVFFVWQPSWPFAQTVPDGSHFAHALAPGADQMVSYHIVLDGPCWGAVAGEEPVRLDTGDILLVPRGNAYVISDAPCQPEPGNPDELRELFRLLSAGELPPVVVNGGPGPRASHLICGFLGCDMQPYNPLLASLPPLLRLPPPEGIDEPLASLLHFAIAEAREGRSGTRCMLLRLSELMFVEVIRRYLREQPAGMQGWAAGLRDPAVARALNLMHRRIDHRWTLDGLAREVGVSRSTLADRFTGAVGEPPMQYLARWRMQVAARALVDGHRKVYAVAREVGYDSEAAFSRAFKRIVGMTPARWRVARSEGETTAYM